MIVSNGRAIKRHTQTNRPLNLWNDNAQVDSSVLLKSSLHRNRKNIIAGMAMYQIVLNSLKRSNSDMAHCAQCVVEYLMEHRDKLINVKCHHFYLKPAQLKKLLSFMEDLGMIEIYQGFPLKVGSRPLAIKATPYLFTLFNK